MQRYDLVFSSIASLLVALSYNKTLVEIFSQNLHLYAQELIHKYKLIIDPLSCYYSVYVTHVILKSRESFIIFVAFWFNFNV